MQTTFDLCVTFLVWLAELLHTDYVTVNVVIFCIVWPAVTIGLIVYSYQQYVDKEAYRKLWQACYHNNTHTPLK